MTLAGVLCLAALSPAAAASREFGADAVWKRPGEDAASIERLHQECASEVNDRAGCLLAFMRREGASEAAVAAARRISEGKREPEGYLSAFEERGRVDFGYAAFPFAANANLQGVLLNGTPSIVTLQQPALRDLEKSEPLLREAGAGIWEADFGGLPEHQSWPDGGQSFTFEFRAATCHSCKNAANVFVAYEFDAKGRFTGIKRVAVGKGLKRVGRGGKRGRGRGRR